MNLWSVSIELEKSISVPSDIARSRKSRRSTFSFVGTWFRVERFYTRGTNGREQSNARAATGQAHLSLFERLAAHSQNVRAKAASLPAGQERDAMLEKLKQT